MSNVYGSDGSAKGAKSADFTMRAGVLNVIDGSAGTVDALLPSEIKEFDTFPIQNLSTSTNQVRVINPNFTITAKNVTATPGDNIIITAGRKRVLIATSTTTMELY